MTQKGRIYAFDPYDGNQTGADALASLNTAEKGETASSTSAASDNEKPSVLCSIGCVRNLTVYEFNSDQAGLQSVYRAKTAFWRDGRIFMSGNVEEGKLSAGKFETKIVDADEISENTDPFGTARSKPSHLNVAGIKDQIANSASELESRNYAVALERKYSTLVLPFVIVLFTVPFAFSLSRKAKVATVGYAIGLWLLFTGTSSVFEQFGLNGFLSPASSIWSPLLIFTMFGVYRLSKVRT